VSHGHRRFHRLPILDTGPPVVGRSDADLLARFVGGRDEAAFELLLRRYGPMVLGVCRRVLADRNDADDAFQATFLVLARKAGAIGRAGVVAAWLHRVAHRAALRVRADRARRGAREQPGADELPGPTPPDPGWAELGRVLDEEVGRLPARHRAAFILCCLEGKTGEEAARLLGCPAGTVSSRLTRARERLRDRLTRRGFAPAAVAAAVAGDAAPAVSARLTELSLSAALAFAAGRPTGGPSPRPVATAEGVMRAMFLHKAQLAALLLLAGLLAAGGLFVGGAGAQPAEAQPPPGRPPAGPPGKVADDKKQPADLPVVQVVRPVKGGIDRFVTQVATAEPLQRVDLYPEVPGRLKAVAADLGDRVHVGQLLAEIDAPELVLDERQVVASVLQAEAKAKEAVIRVGIARAEVVAARGMVKQRGVEATAARATTDYRKKQLDRFKNLAEQKAVDQKLLDEAADQFRAAQALADAADAAVANARAASEARDARLDLAEAGVGTAKADVEAAKVALEKIRLALARTRVIAPFDGVITHRNGWPGESIRPDGRRPLFTLVRADVIRVVTAVSERDLSVARPGVAARVMFGSQEPGEVDGKVSRVGFAVDPANGTVRVEIDIPNPDGKLRPGMSGNVKLAAGKGPADVLRVPTTALLHVQPKDGKGSSHLVFVYRDGQARAVPVRVGYSNGTETEVVAGLAAGDQVVTDPRALHEDDVPVRVGSPPAP
jgi:RND family efflux transporter MFP subunit